MCRYIMKLMDRQSTGGMSIPRKLYMKWIADGKTHLELNYDENQDLLQVRPI